MKNTKPKFTDCWGEPISKRRAVKERCEILYDMYIKPEGEKMIPNGRRIYNQIYWGFILNDKYDSSEALDKECRHLVQEYGDDTIQALAERVSDGTNWIDVLESSQNVRRKRKEEK